MALQTAEYEDGIDDAEHWPVGVITDDDYVEEDLTETDVFGYNHASDPYHRGREYWDGMDGPSREKFLPSTQGRLYYDKSKPHRRHD